MKIAYATLQDPCDVRYGSGTPFHFHRELQRQGHTVHLLGPIEVQLPLATRLLGRISRLSGRRYRSLHDPFVGRRIGRATAARAQGLDFDVLLTNDYGVAAYTPTDRPIVIYTDAIFPADRRRIINPRLENLSAISARLCQRVNRRGLDRAHLCVFPTRWAADEILLYDADYQAKLRVVPFGANLEDPGPEVAASRSFSRILARDRIDLLFVGKDWSGKGGDVALAAVEILRRGGRNVVLHLVGGSPPGGQDTDGVRVHGLLDKRRDEDRALLESLYRDCDLLILPTRGEGFGIAAAEAAAFGMPSLGSDTIGFNEAVHHGRSGILLPPNADAEAYAAAVEGWFEDPRRYDALARGARRHFEDENNWTVAVDRVTKEIEKMLGKTMLGTAPSPAPT